MKLGITELLKIPNVKIVNKDLIAKKVFAGVSIDSRKCAKSDLFFAIKGERFDGHDFVIKVLGRGIKAAVVSKRWYKGLNKADKKRLDKKRLVLVNDTTIALGDLASIYRRKFTIPVLAVAGSNGKTTTKDFIAHVLSHKFNVLKTEGNYNNAIGVPLTLFRLRTRHQVAVVETGTNHFGEVDYLCRTAGPQFGVITNIGKEHLEFFKDINGVARGECELVDYLKGVYGMFFLNNDDKYLRRKVNRNSINVLSYGKNKDNDVSGRIVKYNGFYPEVEIRYNNKMIRTTLNMIGNQSFQSALCAAAIGLYFDVPPGKVRQSLGRFKLKTDKRNELKIKNGISLIDDTYNSNPDSVAAALENLKVYKVKGRKHIVLADMKEMGRTSKKEHSSIGRLIKKMGFENLYTYGTDSKETYRAAKGLKNNFYFEDKQSLIEMLKRNVKQNDLVLVKGSRSMKMEEIVNSF